MGIFNFFRSFRGHGDSAGADSDTEPGTERSDSLAPPDMGDTRPDDFDTLTKYASKAAGIPVFEGEVDHGYAADQIEDPAFCPRCHAETKEMYANFIYATQLAPRVMLAPAGHFCTKCPTVVIDEDLIRMGITDRRFTYVTTLGIDFGDRRPPNPFKTWNGEKLIYILDEENGFAGVATEGRLTRPSSTATANPAKKKAANKNRRKMAERSRRKNRKK